MVDITTFRQIALSFEEVTEQPHFEKSSFRVRKKIFTTLDEDKEEVVLKLTPIDQSVFCSFGKTAIYPVNGGWGKQGWTIVELKKVEKDMLQDALTVAYCTVAPRKLSQLIKTKGDAEE